MPGPENHGPCSLVCAGSSLTPGSLSVDALALPLLRGPGGVERSVEVRARQHHPPAPSPASGLLDSVLTPGSSGGGESVPAYAAEAAVVVMTITGAVVVAAAAVGAVIVVVVGVEDVVAAAVEGVAVGAAEDVVVAAAEDVVVVVAAVVSWCTDLVSPLLLSTIFALAKARNASEN
ncbi:hypothetical protein SprV_0602045600 [Sparganum proliferum]